MCHTVAKEEWFSIEIWTIGNHIKGGCNLWTYNNGIVLDSCDDSFRCSYVCVLEPSVIFSTKANDIFRQIKPVISTFAQKLLAQEDLKKEIHFS